MASCILHVGTHKTGTTALQLSLASENGWVDRAGLFYPRTCRYYGGHHHLPFALLGSPLYDPACGSPDDLLDEVAQNASRTCVVSSEVLHFLAARPDAMRALVDGLARRKIETKVVLYVRERPSYLESLYGQLLRQGLDLTFDEFVRAFAIDGSFRFDAMRRHDVRYAMVAGAFAEAFGALNVIVRAYRSGDRPDDIVRDFLGAVGVPHAEVERFPAERNNPTANFREIVERWLTNRPSRRAGAPSVDDVARSLFGDDAAAVLDGPFRVFDRDDAAAFSARFADDDRELERGYGVRLLPFDRPATALRAARIFEALVRP